MDDGQPAPNGAKIRRVLARFLSRRGLCILAYSAVFFWHPAPPFKTVKWLPMNKQVDMNSAKLRLFWDGSSPEEITYPCAIPAFAQLAFTVLARAFSGSNRSNRIFKDPPWKGSTRCRRGIAENRFFASRKRQILPGSLGLNLFGTREKAAKLGGL